MRHTQLTRFMRGYSSTNAMLVFDLSQDQIVFVTDMIDTHLAQENIHQDGERSLYRAYQREEFMYKVADQFLDLYPNAKLEEYYP